MERTQEAEMADEKDELDGISDDEAQQLLDAPADKVADQASDESEKDSTDWKAEAEKWKKLSRQNEKSAAERAAALKKYEDAKKSESERLQEERDSHKTRAEKAEAALKRREIAESFAPDHATVRQIAQVAKRISGDDDDALEADAKELFELLAPAPEPAEPKAGTKTPARPKERLKGGTAEPDEEPEESDPRKLAALLPRRR
jgi:hypothetical protein